MKKRVEVTLAAIFLTFSMVVEAAGFQSFVCNTETNIPAYEPPIIAGGDMNDPTAPQRYEGVPNPFQTGNANQGKFTFHQLSEDNYCTKITVNDPTATVKGPQPYMQHYDSAGRAFGVMIFDFDLMRDSTSKNLEIAILLKNIDSTKKGKAISFMAVKEGIVSVPNVTKNEENFKKYQNMPVNTWYKVRIVYDIDAGKFGMSINGDDIFTNVSNAELNMADYSAYYCFRITHSTGTTGGSAYADNIYIRHDVGFDGTLLKGSALCKIDSSNAMSRRIGILVDRYDSSIKPFNEGNLLYMPLRFSADSTHAEVEYNSSNGDITLTRDNLVTVLNVNKQSMNINGSAVTPAASFKLINNVTYICAEDIARALYTNVYYDENGYILLTDYSGVQADALAQLGVYMDKEAE